MTLAVKTNLPESSDTNQARQEDRIVWTKGDGCGP
jgi:hypothetical protein